VVEKRAAADVALRVLHDVVERAASCKCVELRTGAFAELSSGSSSKARPTRAQVRRRSLHRRECYANRLPPNT